MNQIVHIFRKDCRRLWKTIASVLLFTFLHGYGDATIGPGMVAFSGFSPYTFLFILVSLSGLILPVAQFLLVVSVIQEESLVGSDEFWLTRPYGRRSLALEKLLFVVLWVVLPMLLHDVFLFRLFGFSLSSAFGLLLWKSAQFGFFLLFAAVLAVLSASFARAVLIAIVAVVGTLFMFFVVFQEPSGPHGAATTAILAILAVVALAALGAVGVIVFQYRFRITSVAAAIGVIAIFACALLARYWPAKVTARWSSRNASPYLQSVQLRPDANLKNLERPGLPASAPNQGRAAFYPFRATGLPEDVSVVLGAIDAQFDAPGQKPVQVFPLTQVRFQPEAAGASSFADAVGPDQLVSFVTNQPGDFERFKDADGTVAGKLFLDGYQSTRVRMPVPPPTQRRDFAIAGRRCQVTSYVKEGKVAFVFSCAELQPGNTSRFQVRLSQNNQQMLPSQSQGDTATIGVWPAFLSPIEKSSYQCEFQLPPMPENSTAESGTAMELLVFSEERVGSANRDLRIEHFRPSELDLRAWEQRGVLQTESTGAQSNNEISPKSK